MNKADLTRFAKSVQTSVSKNSPQILTGIGIAGMFTGTFLALKETPRALRLLEDARYEKSEPLTTVEKAKVVWKPYAPAAATMALSTVCLISATRVSTRRTAALATAYKLSETALSEYREKVVETIGEKKEKDIREKVAKEKIEKNPVSKNEVIITPKGNTLCYDAASGRYFRSDVDKIKKAINELNRRLYSEMYISMNEFYSELGLTGTRLGDELGWNIDDVGRGGIEVDFSAQLAEDDTPCIVIDYLVAPRYDYQKLM